MLEARVSATEFSRTQESESELPEQYFERLINILWKFLGVGFPAVEIVCLNLEMNMSKGFFC